GAGGRRGGCARRLSLVVAAEARRNRSDSEAGGGTWLWTFPFWLASCYHGGVTARALCTAVIAVVGLVLAGPASGAAGGSTHTWHVSLTAPAQFDMTFAELRFKGPGTQTLRLSPTRSAGLY